MRTFYALVSISLLVAGVCLQTAIADEPVDLVKWSQLPDMGAYGYNWSSETVVPSMVADDFLCSNPLPVIDLHWWGSYYAPGPLWPYSNSDNIQDPTVPANQPPGILQGFNVEFYTDVPVGADPTMPWSHPGQLLYEELIPITAVVEAYYGTVTHIGGIQENVWQYNADLPVPFFQDPTSDPVDVDGDGVADGTIYWLKIQAITSCETIQWGWHEAATLWHDNAVQNWPPNQLAPFWNIIVDTDMAFELTVIPEPSFLLLTCLGLSLLLKRRR